MNRGDIVTVAINGDFGKPRPALVIQSDNLRNTETVTVLLITSTLTPASFLRVTLEPGPQTGLRTMSQVMIDKAMTTRREKVGQPIGKADRKTMIDVERCLALFFGFGD
ncbi:type II toxin-antitoxin system PemK/MazF family toxin [Rhizobium sp. G21]|uniref:type II toxin-antitoxin system PemK/MazF family toxin n=1 Tax=Rhizobium sp. G21 TaxID=2758439 RepID=UPI001604837D|nr:type II toxin-antitoxin system PemK/MazF family toxin [Rhizobium sp. G21]MBB1248000.1 type II toxin-antitoxin system PemK/MazF family toxin [Rhizobium sp. G21]